MTARPRVSTNLIVGIIEPLYRMQQEDIDALAVDLERQLRAEYGKVIQAQLNLYKCQKTVSDPDAESTQWIQSYAQTNAEGIANTYNRELSNQISRLFGANSRGNRSYYYKNLDAWTAQRNLHKLPSIGLNTLTAVRRYAQERFVKENGIQGRWRLVGPPPVCKKCIRIKALGVVSLEVTQQAGNELPNHVGCPHQWREIIPKAIECGDMTWTG